MKHDTIEEYYKSNRDRLVQAVSRRAGSPENAEDVVQDAFERAMKYQSSYDSSRPFEAWFVAILNGALPDFKAEERRQGMSSGSVQEDSTDADDLFINKLTDQYKGLLLLGDTVDERYLLELYFFKGYKLREALQITSVKYRRALYLMSKFREEAVSM